MRQYLKDNPAIAQEIETQIRALALTHPGRAAAEVEDAALEAEA